MKPDSPLTFTPLYMERVWGGRRLQDELGRKLPPDAVIGESWELVDREEAQSVVNHGPLAGTTLHELWTQHRDEIFGPDMPDTARFPLLAKILDAREKLSVQVHPPASIAKALHGEPKTEMWYLLSADREGCVYAGFQCGTTKNTFAEAIADGGVEKQLHRIPVTSGDAIFIPSGRCHAIGAGCFIIEIQQNSDTTYRVHDWNRVGLDGKPRALHIAESLASLDFDDHEPALATADNEGNIINCEHFQIQRWTLAQERRDESRNAAIYTVIAGRVRIGGRDFVRGDFALLPACAINRNLTPLSADAAVLRSTIPQARH